MGEKKLSAFHLSHTPAQDVMRVGFLHSNVESAYEAS